MTDVTAAVDALNAGELVVMPTDTVYGVAARPTASGIDALFAAKARSETKALPVLGASVEMLSSVARFDERALSLAADFWPGPLTLVLPRADGFDVDLGGGGLATVAVRVPAHPVALEILRAAGPLAVTSANRSGETPARTVEQARDALGAAVDIYVDAGACDATPSTVFEIVAEPRVLREGSLTAERLLQSLTS